MTHKHCDLLSYLASSDNKNFKDLYELIEDQCWRSIFTTKREYTFLMPGKKTIEQLASDAKNDESIAYEKLRSLFIISKHKDLSKAEELVNFNNKKIKGDYSKMFKNLQDISIDSLKHITIFNYGDEKIPDQEDKRVKRTPKPKKGSNESSESSKLQYTTTLMTKSPKEILHKLSSLLEHCANKCDKDTFEKIKSRLDPNWVLSWFILVKPSQSNDNETSSNTYVTDSIFEEWAADNKLDDDSNKISNANTILEIFETHTTDKNVLQQASKCRADASNVNDMHDLKTCIIEAYKNDMDKLLEDELRFRFADKDIEDTLAAKQDLISIDWNKPKDCLVLICGNLKIGNDDAIYECLKEFVKTNACQYTLYDTNILDKIEKLKKEKEIHGAGHGSSSRKVINILGNHNRAALKKMGSVDSKQLLKSFVKSLSESQKKILKDLL